MPRKSLASALKIQWWLHTCVTSLFFIVLTFFFLFVIEDYFHEKQLVEFGNIISITHSTEGMPPHIRIYPETQTPNEWLAQLEQVPFNKAIEIESNQGTAIHIVRSRYHHSNTIFILALDTSKTNTIWSIVDELLFLILPWLIIFLILASFLAKKFTRQIQGHFKQLLAIIEQSKSPDALAKFAKTESISELAQFAQLFAQVWLQKLDLLGREKQSLEYLSHELRTPIQSSLATLELLALKTEDKKTIERLMRSLKRMTRLSNAILHLMDSDKLPNTYQVDITQICRELVDELQPLAKVKKQSIILNTIDQTPEGKLNDSHSLGQNRPSITSLHHPKIVATQEVIETLLSILLTNALQYGNASPIKITINNYQIRIENEMDPISEHSSAINDIDTPQGFGIGLNIANRLADKYQLKLDIVFNSGLAVATIGSSTNIR
jgi:signal transduction histidine kinase